MTNARRRPTATSNFGVSRREGHDASAFYERFSPPTLSDDDRVNPPSAVDEIWVGDARHMDDEGEIADASVALVVTSPPYFAGKEYEQALGEGHVPASYLEYLKMLHDVFAQCVAKLESGGRMAVNVANLGRKPYRSLSSDVVRILEDLGLLMRGEIIWLKQRGAGGSCAWGSYQRPGNPVLRDLTERVLVASKGRFDRSHTARRRYEEGLPAEGSMSMDEFLDATTDVWEIPPESASRVGHPAPFPVELPRRLIELYTYRGDLVLDPFMGSGSTAVAATRTGRHFVGFDTDSEYVKRALERATAQPGPDTSAVVVPPNGLVSVPAPDDHDAAMRAGYRIGDLAAHVIRAAGFGAVHQGSTERSAGVAADLESTWPGASRWSFLLAGGRSASRPGLRSSETLQRSLGRAALLGTARPSEPVVLLSVNLPEQRSAAHKALLAAKEAGLVSGWVDLLAEDAAAQLVALVHEAS